MSITKCKCRSCGLEIYEDEFEATDGFCFECHFAGTLGNDNQENTERGNDKDDKTDKENKEKSK